MNGFNTKATIAISVLITSTILMTLIYIVELDFNNGNSAILHSRKIVQQKNREPLSYLETLFESNSLNDNNHSMLAKEFYKQFENANLSSIGSILFKNEPIPKEPENNKFRILIWKMGPFLENRHMKSFSQIKHDPFEQCSVNNCEITYNDDDLEKADAVIIHLHRFRNISEFPNATKSRPPNQRWVFLTDESPKYTNMNGIKWQSFNDIFNWSMSYRIDSDIPVPYGRTEPLPLYLSPKSKSPMDIMDLVPFADIKQRDVLVAIAISNCKHDRMNYVKELQKHIDVDIYGGCGTNLKKACPGHFRSDCPDLGKYLFYLSFENSYCEQYMTEKVFWNGYHNGAVPIIMGPQRKFCKMYLPPNSYLHISDYARPKDLAEHIKLMNRTWNDEFFNYHKWRRHFRVINEHGYFGSKSIHYCRICQALNYNDKNLKSYHDTSSFLDPGKLCE